MTSLLVTIFILGYAIIAFETPLKINKAASSLWLGTICWTVWICFEPTQASHINQHLAKHLAEISQILFFLMGAMTIVELVDAHQGFKIITNRITTDSIVKLAWIIGFITFFLSAILDNLTTTIVMVSLVRRLVSDRATRLTMVGLIIIAANAGGAWTPIGDVTTTMLWIGNQITTAGIIKSLFLPALACLLAPLLILSFQLTGKLKDSSYNVEQAKQDEFIKGSRLMFFFGVGGLIFVPAFKLLTDLPPYMGMLFSLSVVWIASELLHIDKSEEDKKPYTAVHALTRIDTASILFFMGILLAVAALEGTGILSSASQYLNNVFVSADLIAVVLGLLSSIIDNVPLVAAVQKMYPLASAGSNSEVYNYALNNSNFIQNGVIIFEGVRYYLTDARMWHLIAYTAGTGGSCLIIGSAAGVAAMGMEKIDFFWYLKKISWLALLGYFAGVGVFLLLS